MASLDEVHDVIVIGGGPAGGSAALQAARLGLRTLLIERGDPQRDKLCSGVIAPHTESILRHLGLDADPSTVGWVEDTLLRFRLGAIRHRHHPYRMVSRKLFDAQIRQAAQDSGARVIHGEAVREIQEKEEGALLLTGAGAYRARVIVGADGTNGVTTRFVNPKPRLPGVAMEAKLPLDAPGSTLIDWGMGGGYRWIFRKETTMGVGVAFMPARPGIKGRLQVWSDSLGIDTRSATGHLLPFALQPRLVRGPVLLAGDAAGAVDPLMGEGIPWALLTGRMASLQAALLLREGTPLTGHEERVRQVAREGMVWTRLVYRMRRMGMEPLLELFALTFRWGRLRRAAWGRLLERELPPGFPWPATDDSIQDRTLTLSK